MDMGALLIVWGTVFLLGGAIMAWRLNDLTSQTRVDRRIAPFLRYKSELSREKAKYEAEKTAMSRDRAREKQEHEALVAELFGCIGQITPALETALDKLPAIQDMDTFFGSMSREMRDELGFTLSPVLAEGAAQITAQQIEAVRKLQELGLRLTLWLKAVNMVQWALPAGVNAELSVAHKLQGEYLKWDEQLTEPAFKAVLDGIMGTSVARLLNEGNLQGGQYTPETLTRVFLTARAEKERQLDELGQQPIAGHARDAKSYYEQAVSAAFEQAKANQPNSNGRLKG